MIEVYNLNEILEFCDDLDAVIFDLDDTLYLEKDYVISGFRAVGEKFPQIIDMDKKLFDAFKHKKSAIDEVLKVEGLWTEENKAFLLSVYRNHMPSISLSEETINLIENLLDKGKLLGVITDGRPNGQRNKIKSLKLEKWIKNIIITDELGGVEFRKPNKTAFIKMQEILGVPFEKMAYVGDNLKKDFVAPELLKMKSIYFKNKNGLYYEP